MKKLLGIDYGDQRIGLALAEAKSIAVPYKIIKNNDNLLTELKKIIQEESIDLIVVGLPHSLSGKVNERLNITKEFINFLNNNLDIPIKTVDETLTSKLFTKMGVKKDIDKHSAMAILNTWLENHDQ